MSSTVNITLKKTIKNTFNLYIFLPTLGLIIIGLISIFSATNSSEFSTMFVKQLFASGIGIGLMIAIYFFNIEWIKNLSVIGYVLSIILLLVVYFFGAEVNGTKGWIKLGIFSLQPSEFAKISSAIFAAWLLSGRYRNINHMDTLAVLAGVFLLPSFLILMQPDFGSFSVFLILYLGILYWSGFNGFVLYTIASIPIIFISALFSPIYFYIIGGLLSSVALFFKRRFTTTLIAIALFGATGFTTPFFLNSLKEYQRQRIETFLNPELDPLGSSYNVLQSILAIGSGGFSGKGFLQGTQTQLKYIPMQWTDFIFSVPNEEFGFIGGATIVILFTLIFWQCLKIASEANDKFSSILTFSILVIFLYHCIINIGMTIGIVPVTGIPLPFLSYGGTSLTLNSLMVGILLNINKNNKLEKTEFKVI